MYVLKLLLNVSVSFCWLVYIFHHNCPLISPFCVHTFEIATTTSIKPCIRFNPIRPSRPPNHGFTAPKMANHGFTVKNDKSRFNGQKLHIFGVFTVTSRQKDYGFTANKIYNKKVSRSKYVSRITCRQNKPPIQTVAIYTS